ncbi:hypothetical protein [Streptomyces triticisoli]|uniref:hypothetical protein n=1 Tax=Streptomyces triticisoli TaxID=2182797 RepID=UPI001300B34E|nr:hypothetical protein [Streptomyces triticisoli]
MAHYEGLAPTLEARRHGATTVEQGRFCLARCTCGWRGPARRARSLARTDAEGHARGTH